MRRAVSGSSVLMHMGVRVPPFAPMTYESKDRVAVLFVCQFVCQTPNNQGQPIKRALQPGTGLKIPTPYGGPGSNPGSGAIQNRRFLLFFGTSQLSHSRSWCALGAIDTTVLRSPGFYVFARLYARPVRVRRESVRAGWLRVCHSGASLHRLFPKGGGGFTRMTKWNSSPAI